MASPKKKTAAPRAAGSDAAPSGAFDLAAFSRDRLQLRTAEVECAELRRWFPEGARPVFVVRGLNGEEFYGVREAVARRRDLQAIAGRLLSGQGEAIAEAIEEFYGGVPDEYARRVEILVAGCVAPALDRPAALKIFKYFPSVGHQLAEQILRLTGEGACVGESSGCGGTPASATT